MGMRKTQTKPSQAERNIIQEFTDREAPQEAFERKFRAFYQDWHEVSCVLSFYGIGGVGKTSLINKLGRVIRKIEGHKPLLLDQINCDYFIYNFETEKANFDKLSILCNFRKQLKTIDPTFLFHRFDSAVLLYAKRTGKSLELDKTVDSLLDDTPWLNGLVKLSSFIPGVSWISSAIEAFDKAESAYTNFSSEYLDKKIYQSYLQEIDMLEASELLDKLHSFFIADMNHNMRYIAKKPIVIFLDAYEKYIDNNNKDAYMITVDHWLRKGIGSSLLRSIPGVFWVIAGRDRLDWADDDWEEILPERPFDELGEEEKEALAESELEQHLLGDLSFQDAVSYMTKAKLDDPSLHKPLYDLTHGTPLYLYICIDTYLQLKTKGMTPKITDFGNNLNELVARYLNCMSDSHKEMAYFLSCLGKWSDESVETIASQSTTLRFFTQKVYQQFLKHSFIIKSLDGDYSLHSVVRSVCLYEADQKLVEEITHLHLEYLKKLSENSTVFDTFSQLNEYVNTLAQSIDRCSYDLFLSHLVSTRDVICNLELSGNYNLLYTISSQLYNTASSHYPDTAAEWITCGEYGRALRLIKQKKKALEIISKIPSEDLSYALEPRTIMGLHNDIACVLESNHHFEKALKLREDVLTTCVSLYSESHIFTARAMINLSYVYYCTGNNDSAIHYAEKALTVLEQLSDLHPLEMLAAKSRLSNYYDKAGKKQEAFALRLEVFEERKKIFSIDNPKTIHAMKLLANSYEDLEDYVPAIALRENILNYYWNEFGDGHPNTKKALADLDYVYAICGAEDRKCTLYESLLQIRKTSLGEGHPDTLATMKLLADAYAFVDEGDRSYELIEQLIQLRLTHFGETDPEVIALVEELASIYSVLDREEKANEYYALLDKLQRNESH